MQIYVNKNGQQLGPFDESKVIEMLRNGQLAMNDLGFKQGQQQWQKLEVLFPTAVPAWTPPPNVPNNPPNFQPNNQPNSQFNNQFQPTPIQPPPAKSGSSKGLIFGLLGCGGLLIVGLIGVVAVVMLSNRKSSTTDYATNSAANSSNTTNSNTSSNVKTPEYYKAYSDKTIELSRLKPPAKLDKNAKLKGKVTVIERTNYNFEFKMIGFDVRSNPNLQEYVSNDETAAKDYGLTFADLAESLSELDTLVQVICQKGRVLGRYSGGINAYANRCNVNVIDYKANAIVAQKTFENNKPEKEIKVRSGQTEEVVIYPYAPIREFIKGLPRQ